MTVFFQAQNLILEWYNFHGVTLYVIDTISPFFLSNAMNIRNSLHVYVTIHHETSIKSPLGHFQFMLYLESTCPKL